jgi:hypothetical protein
MMDFRVSKEELNLLIYYVGFDSAINNIEDEIRKTKTNANKDYEEILKIQYANLKTLRSLNVRAWKFIYPEEGEEYVD